jgi:hypothetical protein
VQKLEFCQRLLAPLMPLVLLGHPLNHPFSMMLSQNLIFVIVFTVHFHVTTWVEAGGWNRIGGGGSGLREAIKAFWTLGIFLLISSTPRLPTTARFKNQNIFPKLQMRAMIRSYTYEPTKFKQDTQGCQKKSISSHKLFIILVTSTIHYATDNNCKEISQDRMHEHHVSKTAKIPICQICFSSSCKLK